MKSILFIIISFMYLTSCDEDTPSPGEIVDIDIDFLLRNNNDKDLLDANTTGNLLNTEIKIYFLENGMEREVYNPDLTCPRNYCILEDTNGNKVFRLFPIDKVEPKRSTIMIHWNANKMDKIEANIISKRIGSNTSTYCDSVWVNGILKFPNNEFSQARKFILKI